MSDEPTDDSRLGGKRPKRRSKQADFGPLPGSKRKPRRERHSPLFNRILNLAILGLLAFGTSQALSGDGKLLDPVLAFFSFDSSQTSESLKAEEGFTAAPKAGQMDALTPPESPSLMKRLMPLKRLGVRVEVITKGDGDFEAQCGQKVEYRLVGQEENGEIIAGESQSLILGAQSEQRGLSLGLLGAKINEIRQIVMGEALWKGLPYHEEEEASAKLMRTQLQVLEITPKEIPESVMPLRRFILREGLGHGLRCGDEAKLHMRLWNSEGELFYDSSAEGGKPVQFRLGEAGIPLGLQSGLQEMKPGGHYTLLIPAALTAPLLSAESAAMAAEDPFVQVLSLTEADSQPLPRAPLIQNAANMWVVDIIYPAEEK